MRFPSTGEATFAFHCRAHGLTPIAEYRFAPPRRWRADFAFIEAKLLVEIEGGVYTMGRHTRGAGFEADCEKYNAATAHGWRVLRFTPAMVKSGVAIEMVKILLTGTSYDICDW